MSAPARMRRRSSGFCFRLNSEKSASKMTMVLVERARAAIGKGANEPQLEGAGAQVSEEAAKKWISRMVDFGLSGRQK